MACIKNANGILKTLIKKFLILVLIFLILFIEKKAAQIEQLHYLFKKDD
jgi:uncharacterized integral membrane protein